jgi:uncharacterized protein (TIGR00296 family)
MSYSGEYLVKLARRTIETYLSKKLKIKPPKEAPKDLWDQSGVFVTLHTVDNKKNLSLRGCIGRIQSPGSSLIQSTVDSAIDAAINDPRFPRVSISELDNITVEVTVLTVPKKIEVEDPEEYLKIIKIGQHGLIAEQGAFYRGLLLPQVPVEQKWNVEEYLNYVCMKAGLAPDAWRNLSTSILAFEGFIFSEKSPHGEIVAKSILSE